MKLYLVNIGMVSEAESFMDDVSPTSMMDVMLDQFPSVCRSIEHAVEEIKDMAELAYLDELEPPEDDAEFDIDPTRLKVIVDCASGLYYEIIDTHMEDDSGEGREGLLIGRGHIREVNYNPIVAGTNRRDTPEPKEWR